MNAIIDETRKVRNESGKDPSNGRFVKGNKGKPKGAKDKTTRSLRECVLEAGRQAGDKIEPGGGMTAYLRNIAETQPQLFTPLIGRVLPLDVTSSDGSMRPVVALYMPDNRRDARVIDAQPEPVTPVIAQPVECKALKVLDSAEYCSAAVADSSE